MKKIIGFYGIGRSGKATTLNMLIALLSPHYANFKRRNVRVCLPFRNHVICIATCGDTLTDINETCNFFRKTKFDIAITATRSKGKSCKGLVQFAQEEKTRIEWVEKKKDYFNPTENDHEQAQELLNLLDSYTTINAGEL